MLRPAQSGQPEARPLPGTATHPHSCVAAAACAFKTSTGLRPPRASGCAGRASDPSHVSLSPSWGKDLAGPSFPVPKPCWSRKGGRGPQAAEPEVPATGRALSRRLWILGAAAHLINLSRTGCFVLTAAGTWEADKNPKSPVDHPRSLPRPKARVKSRFTPCPPLKGDTLSG